MVQKEFYKTRNDGVNLFRTYSDEGVQIRKVGTDEIYDEAIDIEGAPYQYEETDIPIAPSTEEEIEYEQHGTNTSE